MREFLLPSKGRCPKCGREAVLQLCKTCGGKRKLSFTAPGQWSPQDLRKNPFLPYYKSPPPKVTFNDCQKCNGTGKVLFCSVCGQSPAPKEPRLFP